MSAITINGDLVHYEVLGRGRPIILLHSWLGSWRYWIPTMQQLSVKYRIYALDLWGFGDSGKNQPYYSIDGQADLIEKFLDKMGIPKAVFVGHGLGAAVMAHFANKPNCSQIVHRMMTISTPVFGSGFREETAKPAEEPKVQEKKPETPTPPALPSFMPQASIDSPTIPSVSQDARERLRQAAAEAQSAKEKQVKENTNTSSEAQDKSSSAPKTEVTSGSNPFSSTIGRQKPGAILSRHMDTSSADYEKLKAEVEKADEGAIRTSAESLSQYNPLRNLLKVGSPTLSVYGVNDTLVPPPDESIETLLKEKNPQINLILLDNARHFPMLEDTPRFTRLLREFLEISDLAQLQMKSEWKRRMR